MPHFQKTVGYSKLFQALYGKKEIEETMPQGGVLPLITISYTVIKKYTETIDKFTNFLV